LVARNGRLSPKHTTKPTQTREETNCLCDGNLWNLFILKKTGDPHCPPHVLQAKRIMDAIIQRTDAGEGVPEDGLGFED